MLRHGLPHLPLDGQHGQEDGRALGRRGPEVSAPRQQDGADEGPLRVRAVGGLLRALRPPAHQGAEDEQEPQEFYYHPPDPRQQLLADDPAAVSAAQIQRPHELL